MKNRLRFEEKIMVGIATTIVAVVLIIVLIKQTNSYWGLGQEPIQLRNHNMKHFKNVDDQNDGKDRSNELKGNAADKLGKDELPDEIHHCGQDNKNN